MLPQKVYHYTSANSAAQINHTGVIRAGDGICGPGVYFTGLGPLTEKGRLVQNNQDCRPSADSRVAYYYEYETRVFNELLKGQVRGRDVWIVRDDVPIHLSVHKQAVPL